MKFSRYTLDDWILLIAGVSLILFVLWLLTGCGAKELADTKILWSENADCLLYVEGVSAQQAKDITRDMSLKDCDVIMNTDIGSRKK